MRYALMFCKACYVAISNSNSFHWMDLEIRFSSGTVSLANSQIYRLNFALRFYECRYLPLFSLIVYR